MYQLTLSSVQMNECQKAKKAPKNTAREKAAGTRAGVNKQGNRWTTGDEEQKGRKEAEDARETSIEKETGGRNTGAQIQRRN